MGIAVEVSSLRELAVLSLMPDDLIQFQKRLKIEFSDLSLLELALTHRSVGKKNNERLEFFGDAVLGFIISEKLFKMYPNVKEGDLSRLRASLVRKEVLADLARQYGFSDVLRVGSGELKSGGANRDSVLGDAFEAVIGALMIDKDIKYVRHYLLDVYTDKLNSIPALETLKDPKTRLQELLQSRKLALPEYIKVYEKKEHPQKFTIACKIPMLQIEVEADGNSRRKAEQLAAEKALVIIGKSA